MKQIKITKTITNRDEESFKLYLKDIAKIPLISADEEKTLWELIKDGNIKARNRLVEGNLRFVITCAKHFQGQGLSLGELVAEGNKGLIRSVSHYDPTKGVKFISYAVNWIEQAIMEAISCTSRTIRLPISHLNDKRKIHNASLQLEQKLGREASIQEIADSIGMDERKVSKTIGTSSTCVSLENPFENSHDDTTCLLDIVPNGSDFADDYINAQDKNNMISQAISILSDRSRVIVIMFFGLGVNPTTLEEIGTYLGLTSERVRQIKDESLEIMHKYIISHKLL